MGEPFTVVPTDLPDVECQVLGWSTYGTTKPTLTLLCPPEQVFAPLRVLIKLSWLEEGSKALPVDPGKFLIVPGEKTSLRTRKESAFVHLRMLDAAGKPHHVWVSFTGVVDVALLQGTSKRIRQRSRAAAS
jgi:hypothetical protein